MANRLYVGNIPFAATNESLTHHFSQAGAVTDVQMMTDKLTGRPRGFAFITMATDADAQNAVSQLHGQPYEGRPLTVTEARPREDRPAGGPPRRDFGGGAGATGGGGGGAGGGGARVFNGRESRPAGGGGGGRRPDRGDRNRGERGERGERPSPRDHGSGGGRRFELGDLDDGE